MKIIAYDLGTGGVKASLYDERMHTMAKSFVEYKTYYPKSFMHEQRPDDWWQGVIESTKNLLAAGGVQSSEVGCVSLSGHSLVTVPMDKDTKPLMEYVPIWSDARATEEVKEFFANVDENEWYLTTGNGFPPPCYSIFKLMWLRKNQPDVFSRIHKVLGSKDYINFMLTGKMMTDNSYASGMGAYGLMKGGMNAGFLKAAGIPEDIFPEIVPSHTVVGKITPDAAAETGLLAGTLVACGGVDNACMALGAVGPAPGGIYVSLGSSSWIPVNSSEPVLDIAKRPYVFAHIAEGMFTSAFSIFSGGSSLKWVKDTLCKDISGEDAYAEINSIAASAPIGSNGILFNPSLAGGTSQDKSINIRGAYVGLSLMTSRADIVRAAMEGIALNLRLSLDFLKQKVRLSDEILFCGGGSKSPFWMQMFADVFGMDIIKTNIDQDAASLGAAAIAARAAGLWDDYDRIPGLHVLERRSAPDSANVKEYAKLLKKFAHANEVLADLGDYMMEN